MNLIEEMEYFYKDDCIFILIVNIFYYYIIYLLCLAYLAWFPIYIIINNNLHEFANENYTNTILIFYAIYKIHSFFQTKRNYLKELFFESIFLLVILYDFINNNNLYYIQSLIMYSILCAISIFVYGTLYIMFKTDFHYYDNNNENIYIEYIADICSENV
jgi:hypothetical protein